jgi:hypothetical protein
MKIGQREQARKPAREELETIDSGNEKNKRKIEDMDDMIAKPRERENHVQILKDLSRKKYKLRLNHKVLIQVEI